MSQSHYAGKWVIPAEDQRNDLGEINAIGREHALAPDSPEKEAHLLTLLEAFHSYMSKYLVMIVTKLRKGRDISFYRSFTDASLIDIYGFPALPGAIARSCFRIKP